MAELEDQSDDKVEEEHNEVDEEEVSSLVVEEEPEDQKVQMESDYCAVFDEELEGRAVVEDELELVVDGDENELVVDKEETELVHEEERLLQSNDACGDDKEEKELMQFGDDGGNEEEQTQMGEEVVSGLVVEEEEEAVLQADNEESLSAEEEEEKVVLQSDNEVILSAEENEGEEIVGEEISVGRQKRKEVFLGGLNQEVTEYDINEVFSSVGEVREVRLIVNKGIAFIQFATMEQAERAATELKHLVMRGKECGVRPSRDTDILVLDNICKSWTMGDVKEKLNEYDIEGFEVLKLVEDQNNEGRHKAHIEFSSRSDARIALDQLRKGVCFGIDELARIKFDDPLRPAKGKVWARLSKPFQGDKINHVARADFHTWRGSGVAKVPWAGSSKRISANAAQGNVQWVRRSPLMSVPQRSRPFPPHRSYKAPVPAYSMNSPKEGYKPRHEIPSHRSNAGRALQERRALDTRYTSKRW